MKRLILHIGCHKTGSTALQGFFSSNAEILERDTGIFFPVYPTKYSPKMRGHNGNFLYCQAFLRANDGKRPHFDNDKGSDWVLKRFVEQVKEHDTILLTDERIWKAFTTTKGYLKALHDIIRECGIEQTDIVLYIRRQDEYVESFWKQWVKSEVHYTRSLDEHLRTQKRSIRRYLDFNRGIERLVKEFGKEHVTIRRYQKNALINGDIRYDFANAIGFTITNQYIIPETVDLRSIKGNMSLSNNLTEITRIANLSPTFREKSFKGFRNAARAASLVSPESSKTTSMLPQAKRDEILQYYKEGNASVAQEYFGIENGELFDPPSPDIVQWAPDALSLQHDTIILFSELMAQMESQIDDLQTEINALKKANESRLVVKIGKFCKRLVGAMREKGANQ